MYVVNRLPKSKRRLRSALFALLFVGILGAAGAAAMQYFEAETTISKTPEAKVTKVLGSETKVRNFAAGVITIDLPQDWEQFTPADTKPGSYSWRNTAGNKGVRVITAYVDGNIPKDLAVNRVLAVQGEEDRIILRGSVSDNCTNFVASGRMPHSGSGKEPARWDGVQFTCDTANYVRNVVGISSPEGPNMVKLTGKSGAHQVFLTYNDAGATPDHSIFTSAIESLRVR